MTEIVRKESFHSQGLACHYCHADGSRRQCLLCTELHFRHAHYEKG